MRAFEFLSEATAGPQAMSYKRSNRYPDGSDIPDSLPDRYQPASNPGVPSNQKCSNCGYYDTKTKKCDKFKGDPVVKPAYWCAKWEPMEHSMNEDAPAPKKVGREFNHLEDLVFTEQNGAARAVKLLRDIAQDARDITVKWDGSPTVYWGREPNGQFRLVGKNNWGREEGASNSPKELEAFINSRGKGEEWRPKFAADMAAMWNVFEAATPEKFRGYVYGDILFHPGKPYTGADGRISFTPNQTTYSVRGVSDYGRMIAGKKVAVVAHKKLDFFGDKEGDELPDVSQFNSPELAVFGQTYVSHAPAVDADNLATIQQIVNKNASNINQFLSPVAGMGYLRETLYTFVNTKSKAKQLDDINTEAFFSWLNAMPAKHKKITEHNAKFDGILDIVFELVRELMKAKNEVIAELDQATGDITAHTAGEPGGEGYVYKDTKLVPRHRWTPFRAD